MIKILKKINRRSYFLFGLIIFYVFSFKLPVILLFLSIILIALSFSNSWSFFKKLAFAVISLFILNTIIAYVFYFIHIPLDPFYIGTIYVFLSGFYLVFIKKTFSFIPFIAKMEFIYLLAPLIILSLFLSGITRYDNGKRLPIMFGWDSAAHFAMVKQSLDEKQLLINSSFYQNTPWGMKLSYPPSFYINTSITFSFFQKSFSLNNIVYLINYFSIFPIFLILVFVYIFQFLIEKYDEFSDKFNKSIVLVPFSIFFSFGLISLPLYFYGFFGQLIAILYLTVFVYLFKTEKLKSPSSLILVFMLLNFAISASWWVLLPVSIGLTTFFLYKNFDKKNFIIFVLGTLFAAIPVVLNLFGIESSGYFSETFNFTGDGFGNMNFFLLLGLLVSTIFYFSFVKHKKNEDPIILAIFWSAIYSLIIFLIQLFVSGGPGYFFYKTFYSLSMLLGIFVYLLLFKISAYLLKKQDNLLHKYFIGFLILLVLLISSYFVSGQLIERYTKGFYAISKADYNTLIYTSSLKKYSDFEIIPFSSNYLVVLYSQSLYPNITSLYKSEDVFFHLATIKWDSVYKLYRHILEERGKRILVIDYECIFKDRQIKDGKRILDLNRQHLIEIYPKVCSAFATN